ncbi:M14 family zinc carboxypeptidase, partial [Cutibacterium acnes]
MEVANPIVTFDRAFGTSELDRCLEQLSETYSSLHMESIGNSVLGRPLHAVRIGQGAAPVFLNGAFHAN